MYPIIEVLEQSVEVVEQLGTKPKFWYRGADGRSYLFKENRPDSGEHWAEKAVSEICNLIGIPHANYDLARYKEKKGVICNNFVPQGGVLIHGNELLLARDEKYPVARLYRVKEHTLELVMHTIGLIKAQPPVGWKMAESIQRGTDVFVGYLMLDAFIANQDRHHENWGLIWTKEKTIHLAPSYDHASSLGRNESDDRRNHRLTTKGRDGRLLIEGYVENAQSAFYGDSARLKTIDAFSRAAKRNPSAGKFWLNQLNNLTDRAVQEIFDRIPASEVSEMATKFAQSMLRFNKLRLLDFGAKLL